MGTRDTDSISLGPACSGGGLVRLFVWTRESEREREEREERERGGGGERERDQHMTDVTRGRQHIEQG